MHTELFQREHELLRAAEQHLEANEFSSETQTIFSDLIAGFRKELRQSRRLLTLGDRMQAELAHIANTDGLTGLCNRRNFMELARRELRRARRTGRPLSLIMADVDFFKRVNDTWGHDAGDEVLRALARTMRTSLREVDICARLGGEEFALLLPETDRAYARQAAERLRSRSEEMVVEHGRERISVTLSLGLTTWHPGREPQSSESMHLDSLLKSGDIALYAAKKNGRNRIETYPVTRKVHREPRKAQP